MVWGLGYRAWDLFFLRLGFEAFAVGVYGLGFKASISPSTLDPSGFEFWGFMLTGWG